MALNTVTLTWDLTSLIQSGLQATLYITPTAELIDVGDSLVFPPVTVPVNFTGTGQLKGIVANDNVAITPSGAAYSIYVAAVNGQVIIPQFTTQILFSGGATQDLSKLVPVPGVIPAVLNDLDGGWAAGGGLAVGALDGGHA